MIDLTNKTYRAILEQMLAQVPNTFDKRDTSPIQTALAPAAYALEEFYLNLDIVQKSAFIQSATGDDLDQLAVIGNVTRFPASAAVRVGAFNVQIPIGSRFSTVNGADSINFVCTGEYTEGWAPPTRYTYRLTAETPGTIGNEYTGVILPISVIPGLNTAVIEDILVLGDDTETDDELRARLIEALTDRPFAGNISAYRQAALAIDGVGGVQVYPTWNGGGTVKLSVIGTDYAPATEAVIEAVQTAIDPEVNQGQGLGLAPIGAIVTVGTATGVEINVSASVSLAPGFTIEQVTPLIEEAISAYLLSVRKAWDTQLGTYDVSYTADVYYARILAAILSVTGVVNVPSLTVNGGTSDIAMTETGALQQIPIDGTVVISE